MSQCPSCGGDCGRTKATGCHYEAMDIHSCSYYCDRPDCIKAQRDELRDKVLNRTWVGLTDAEIEELDMAIDGTVYCFVHAVEAMLKEKNV